MKKLKKQEHELTIQVYQIKGQFTPHGHDNSETGMIYFSTGYNSYATRGDSKTIAKDITSYIQVALKKNINLPFIKFEYPNICENVANYLDGYFGRPQICSGFTILKPLPKTKRKELSKELNEIGSIQDKRGKIIELRA